MPVWERKTQIIVLALVCSLVFGIGYKYAKISAVPKIEVTSQSPEEQQTKEEDIVVHVTGAVGQPGVYILKSGARVNDAVQKAEPLPEANLDAINLAALLEDGKRIEVPLKGQSQESGGGSESASKGNTSGSIGAEDDKINLNLASLEELDTLPGIGPAYAERIVAYRDEHGGFSSTEELQDIAGIGPKTYERLKDLVCTY